jgi:hypothetical protein
VLIIGKHRCGHLPEPFPQGIPKSLDLPASIHLSAYSAFGQHIALAHPGLFLSPFAMI